MVRFADLPFEVQQALDRITPLSLGIVGKSLLPATPNSKQPGRLGAFAAPEKPRELASALTSANYDRFDLNGG